MGCFSGSGEPYQGGLENATKMSGKVNKIAHQRLRKLQELDQTTKIPFILVELTGEGDGKGEIEVCGKNEYGVYEFLDDFLQNQWGCKKLDHGSLSEDTKIPFCNAQYEWNGFRVEGDEGLNNMGKSTMSVIDFVSGQHSWTLAMVNGGNVGEVGEVRETQIVFKAPHPMNLVAPHMLIELRSAGYIEVCCDLDDENRGVLDVIDAYFKQRFKAELLDGHEDFCDRYYKAAEDVFKGTSGSPESNFNLLTTEVCDKIVKIHGWSLVSANSGNYGDKGQHSEQQLLFRKDYHPLGDATYTVVTLNDQGEVEINGTEKRGVVTKFTRWLQNEWKCTHKTTFQEGQIYTRRYTWEAKDLIEATVDVVKFFEMEGFEMQVTSQQVIKEQDNVCKEQMMFFRPGKTEVGTIEPHLFLELYAGEGDAALYDDEEATQILAKQRVRLEKIGPAEDCKELDDVVEKMGGFIKEYLGGAPDPESPGTWNINVFMCRGRFENNLAQWTMRICDFLVDAQGWSFLMCSLCNMGDQGQYRGQQLLFRWDGDKRDIPVSLINWNNTESNQIKVPDYWTDEKVRAGESMMRQFPCTPEEKEALQTMLDSTFKRVLTRDRRPDDDAPDDEEMPYRLELEAAFRSEHRALWYKYQDRRERDPVEDGQVYLPKTSNIVTCLIDRLEDGDGYLYHGTNPSSAMSILKTGFVLDHAGSATGTMFGAGVYQAECSSKSDEYGRDDGGNTYPSLCALLICRCFIGKPYVVESAGDHVETARNNGYDCVVGDREKAAKTYKEYVFFEEASVYPEFAVIYRRQYDKNQIPPELEHLKCKTSGTTGRFWQMKPDKYFKNVPPLVNKILIESKEKGINVVSISLGGTDYTFNIEDKVGINRRTGNQVQLRAPMHG